MYIYIASPFDLNSCNFSKAGKFTEPFFSKQITTPRCKVFIRTLKVETTLIYFSTT